MPTDDRDEFFLDPRSVRRAFDAASATYAASAGVQSEIAGRLIERLDLVRLEPSVVLDLGAGPGGGARALKHRYPRAEVLALDASIGMLREAKRAQGWLRRFHRVGADAHRLPLKTASVDLVVSNLMLEWCASPDEVFREMRRVLRPGGLASFTTLGPDTLKELRDAWRSVDDRPHVHRFIDMHDLGDALVRARFAEPVMDVERLTITYTDLPALRRELKASGASNVAAGRRKGATTRSDKRAVEAQLAAKAYGGRLPISLEVIYGHAWAGESVREERPRGEFRVPLTVLKGRRKD